MTITRTQLLIAADLTRHGLALNVLTASWPSETLSSGVRVLRGGRGCQTP